MEERAANSSQAVSRAQPRMGMGLRSVGNPPASVFSAGRPENTFLEPQGEGVPPAGAAPPLLGSGGGAGVAGGGSSYEVWSERDDGEDGGKSAAAAAAAG